MSKKALETREHYDRRAHETGSERRQSAILPLRKANNAVKSALLSIALQEALKTCRSGAVCVLDLGCGKGGDLPKWGALSEAHGIAIDYRGIDISKESLQELRKRATALAKRWPRLSVTVACANFCERGIVPRDWPLADIVSAQFALHYAFASRESAAALFDTIGALAAPQALFVGTLVDARQLTQRWAAGMHIEQEARSNRVYAVAANTHYSAKIDLVNLERLLAQSSNQSDAVRQMYDVAYVFSLDQCVDACTEYLVDSGLFEHLAAQYSFGDANWSNFTAFNCHRSLPYEQASVLSLYCAFLMRRKQC